MGSVKPGLMETETEMENMEWKGHALCIDIVKPGLWTACGLDHA